MKKLILIPVVAAIAAIGSPFASVAMAAEKPAQAATVCIHEGTKGAAGIETKVNHICILEKRGEVCEHAEA